MGKADKQHKIGIIGAGSMGCLYASLFHRGGIETVIYERDSDIVAAARAGIVVYGEPPETISIPVSADRNILADCSMVFFFVKSYATEEAARDVAPALNEACIAVTLQNGLGNHEKIRERLHQERIVLGTTSMGASKKDARTVVPGGAGTVIIGGRNAAAVRSVFGVLVHCSIPVVLTDDPETALWKKAVVNAGINPLGAVLGVPNGRIIENPDSLKLQDILVGEAVRAAVLSGVALELPEMIELTRDVCTKTGNNICSMLQDIRAGRKTEIESITGEIIRAGRPTVCSFPATRPSICWSGPVKTPRDDDTLAAAIFFAPDLFLTCPCGRHEYR